MKPLSPDQEKLLWTFPRSLEAAFGVTTLELPDGTVLLPERQEFAANAAPTRSWTYFYSGGYEVRHGAQEGEGTLCIETTIFSSAPEGGALSRVVVGKGLRLSAQQPFEHVYWQTGAMDGFSGVVKNPASFDSWGQAGITDADGERAGVVGFLEFVAYDCRIAGEKAAERNAWLLNSTCILEGRRVAPDRPLPIPALRISTGASLAGLMHDYATEVGRKMHARTQAPAPVGWCSWYGYYGRENEHDILANLDVLAREFPPGQAPVFQIDDGWNRPGPEHPRVWGDWTPGAKFADGMAAIATKIRARHFVPGLWLAPFSVDRTSRLFSEHPDWLVQQPAVEGLPSRPAPLPGDGNVFALDLTHPEVLAFLRSTFRRVFQEWGFDYAKIDFLQQALVPGQRWDREQTPIEAFRAGLEIIRREAGDKRFILACGSPFGPSIGLCDGMRVGLDTGGGWLPPFTLPDWPNGNCSVRAAALPAFYRQWMHRTWWVNDPDCLIARQEPFPCEVEELTNAVAHFQPVDHASTFFLTDEEAGFSIRLIWMLGGAAISSDIWSGLSPERLNLLRTAFPPNPRPTAWIDWYHDHEVCLLRTQEGPPCVGLFNHSDRPAFVELPASRFDLPRWKFTERFSGESFSGAGQTLCFPALPGRSARVWELDAL